MRLSIVVAFAALAACGQGRDKAEQAAPAKEIVVRSDAQKQLFDLNELNRAIALKRGIRDSGSECLRVTKSGFVGRYKNMDYWTASCQDQFDRTRDWALFIGADDSVQVRLCEDVAKVGLPACVIDAKATPAAG